MEQQVVQAMLAIVATANMTGLIIIGIKIGRFEQKVSDLVENTKRSQYVVDLLAERVAKHDTMLALLNKNSHAE